MTDSAFCGFDGDREDALIACLYEDGGGTPERALFEAHLVTCARCREELAVLRGVRSQLAQWAPPEPAVAATLNQPHPAPRNPQSALHSPESPAPWWQQVPAWAQVAAALLFLGVSAAVANLDVRYDANGLRVRTGWMQAPAANAGGAPANGATPLQAGVATPWQADLTALEQQLQSELRSVRTAASAATPRSGALPDADLVRRVRALVEESEKRQQRELALRVAEVMRDVAAQRQADLVKIDRTLGVVQNNLGVEVMRDRQRLDILYRASQRQ
jgi:hypothetical protein